jgi:hypothetical protein
MSEMDAEHCQKNRHGGANVSRTNLLQFMPNSIVFYFCRTITDSMQASYSDTLCSSLLTDLLGFFYWILVFLARSATRQDACTWIPGSKGEGDKGNEVIKRCS